ncbi:transposase domain-containing protein [Litchfieldella rifensis]|uniref:Transposase domain-containing protein n=1 Tax=Litchfieldella rifensis TaxID=762643 RepID=A0ABV7LHV5_9GAMM
MFSQSVKGVTANANLYSLFETAKANGLEPHAYLRYLFAELPRAKTVATIEALLPGNLDKVQIKISQSSAYFTERLRKNPISEAMIRLLRLLARPIVSPFRHFCRHTTTGMPRSQRTSMWLVILDLVAVAVAVAAVIAEALRWVEAVILVLGFSILTDLMIVRSMERTRHVDAKSGVEAMLGSAAVVEKDFEVAGQHARGRVRYNSESWAARAETRDAPKRGETVTIVAVHGITLHVARQNGDTPRE